MFPRLSLASTPKRAPSARSTMTFRRPSGASTSSPRARARQRVGHQRVVGGDPVHPRLPRPARRRRRGRRRPARQLGAAQRVQLAQAAGKPRRQGAQLGARRGRPALVPPGAQRQQRPVLACQRRRAPPVSARPAVLGSAKSPCGRAGRQMARRRPDVTMARRGMPVRRLSVGSRCFRVDAGLAGDGRSCGREEPRQGGAGRQQVGSGKGEGAPETGTGRGRRGRRSRTRSGTQVRTEAQGPNRSPGPNRNPNRNPNPTSKPRRRRRR